MFNRIIKRSRPLFAKFSHKSIASCSSGHYLTSNCPETLQDYNLSRKLLRFFIDKIKTSGPISVHEYMQTCVGSSLGYYSRFSPENKQIFGNDGDFVTSPELTQIFGELIGIWCLQELACTSHAGNWQLIELGPGTGELVKDIHRVLHFFGETKFSLHLVEMSDALIRTQERKLCGNEKGTDGSNETAYIRMNRTTSGTAIFWYRDIDEIPPGFSVVVANEYIDALPVHQFTRIDQAKNQWREILVGIDNKGTKLRFVLSRNESIHSVGLIPQHVRHDSSFNHWEVGPSAGTFVNQLAERLVENGGIGLLIDYGHDGDRRTSSLRSYYQNRLADPLQWPGSQDLTVDVNFHHLRTLVQDRLCIYGPVTQRHFLFNMGISLRLKKLVQKCATDEQKQCLIKATEMLLSPNEMGDRFKVMAVFPKTLASVLEARKGPSGFAID